MDVQAFSKELQSFFFVDEESTKHTSKAFDIIEPHLPGILDEFYEHLQTREDLSAILAAGSRDVETLKKAQTDYWRDLFNSATEASYAKNVQTVGLIHAQIGLLPRWYIGGYALVTRRVLGVLIAETSKQSKSGLFSRKSKAVDTDVSDMVEAVTKTIFMDMAMAIAVYQQTRDAASERVMGTTEKFTSEVMGRIEESASATMELGASSEEISRETQQSTALVDGMSGSIADVQVKVTQLAEMTQDINSILDLIRNVSDQTSLLALNASIEAARAGDAGRGFAVVADEVKKLAATTEESVVKIVESIEQIVKTSDETTTAVGALVSSTDEMRERSKSVATSVEQQSIATSEISDNFDALKTHVQDIGTQILNELQGKK